MAKKKPLFYNAGDMEILDGSTNTLDESLIQTVDSSQDGILSATDYITFKAGSTGDSLSRTFVAGQDMGAAKAVYAFASNTAKLAAYNSNAPSKIIGFSTGSAASGATVTVKTGGKITGLTGLTVNNPVFLDSAGGITQTAKVSSGVYSVKLGYATESNVIDFSFKDRILLA